MRDGLEIGLLHRLIEPKPSLKHQIILGSTQSAGQISRVDIAMVRAGRVATVVRDGMGRLKLIIWDLDGGRLIRRGDAVGDAVSEVAVCSAGLGMMATPVIDSTGKLEVYLWRVDEEGNVAPTGFAAVEDKVNDVAVCRADLRILATAARRDNGTLRMDVWKLWVHGKVAHLGSKDAGESNTPMPGLSTPHLAISGVGAFSVVTQLRAGSGYLKTILWGLDEGQLRRIDDKVLGEGPVGKIASCTLARELAVTALQDKNNELKVIAHRFPSDGRLVEQGGTAKAGSIGDVAICRIGTELFVTGVRAGSGYLKLILWQISKDGNLIVCLSQTSNWMRT